MKRWNMAWVFTLTMLFGVWGCARNNAANTTLTDRIQSLEAKTIRLDEDFRSASAQRDQFKKKLIAEEDARAQLQLEVEKLQLVVKDLHETKVQLQARTQERDQLVAQYDGFRKNLREILGQADTAMLQLKQPLLATPTAGLKETPVQVIPVVKPIDAPKTSGI
jgi:chromosome segregation ATPase